VRQRIGGLIVQTIAPARMPLPVLTLDAELEGLLNQAVRTGKDASTRSSPASPSARSGDRRCRRPAARRGAQIRAGHLAVARRALARLLRPHIPDVPVLSFLEIPDGKPVEVVAVVGGGSEPRPARSAA
jgi:flagellar biosynthesis protein FlhA